MSAAPVAWIAGFGGAYLVYAAITNRSPLQQLAGALNGNPTSPVASQGVRPAGAGSGPSGGGGTTTGAGTTTAPAPSTTTRTVVSDTTGSVDLVSIAGGHRLAPAAATAYNAAVAAYGRPIPLTDSFRSYAQQAECYRLKPQLCSPPGRSLHEKGLAIDINQNLNLDDPRLVSAMQSTGWFRNGRKIVWKGVTRPEPWHWSFGVAG